MSLPFPKLTPEELLSNCYQCGKCTAGCPVAARMDITPNQLIRTVQLGQTAAALRSQAIWECVSCQTCSTRCPKKVDCAAVMDGLREISLAEGMVAASQQPTVSFQQAFLDNIRRNGRLVELELIAQFKTAVFFRTGRLAFFFRTIYTTRKTTSGIQLGIVAFRRLQPTLAQEPHSRTPVGER